LHFPQRIASHPYRVPASAFAGQCLTLTGRLDRKDRVMAAHDTPEYSTAAGNDYAAHEQTYLSFLALLKWCLIAVIIILIGMAVFLT
jgi:hypothetical protein